MRITIRFGRAIVGLAAAALIPGCLDDVGGGDPPVEIPAPSNLTASASADGTSIALAWTDNSTTETGFRVEVAPGPINTNADVTNYATLPPDATSYVYPTLPNTTRYFRVFATTAAQQSKPSNVVSATTPDVPIAPTGVDALVGPNGSDVNVVVYWNDLSNETGYQVDRSEDGTTWQNVLNPGMNSTSATDTTTVLGKEYRYRVRGVNAQGTSAWSAEARAQTRNPNWSIISSSTTGDTSWHTSIAASVFASFLRTGTSVVAYDATNGTLVYGLRGSTSVNVSPIDPGFPTTLGFSGTSIALNVRGIPHIVANDVAGNTLYHLTTGGTGSWTASPVAASTINDRAVIRMWGDTLHVIYQSTVGTATRLRHAWALPPAAWQFEDVSPDLAPDYFAFTIGGSEQLQVTYRRPLAPGTFELVYATKRAGESWTTAVVPTAGNVEFCSIAAGPSGSVHIVYNEITTAGLHYTTNVIGNWLGEVVHQSYRGSWGRYNATVVDSGTGDIHIAYYDSVSRNLRHAVKRSSGQWTYELVDGIGDVGRFCSISLDEDEVVISYGDATNGQVKVAGKLR